MARNATTAAKVSSPIATEDGTLEAEVDTKKADTEAATKPAKPDGRKRRWRDHKIARREELVDGTLAAIRLRGREIGMDEIASEIGISKTVLYRYFTDKNDLTNATMTRYVETTLAPRIYTAISEELDEYQLTRAVIAAYVETVATDPEVYLYVMANNAGTNRDVVAESERMIAELLATVLGERLRARGRGPHRLSLHVDVGWNPRRRAGRRIAGQVQIAAAPARRRGPPLSRTHGGKYPKRET